ncbi:hypothetical protein, partial [Glaesserella parasuis]|uniref:hypothetical protein n=1 Tax=Glaesserella parasuis TaxID=738 RepID=UPI002437437F
AVAVKLPVSATVRKTLIAVSLSIVILFCFLIGNNYILKSHFFSLFISLKCTPSIAIKLNV